MTSECWLPSAWNISGGETAKKLLKTTELADIPALTEDQIEAIPGFGALTANAIAEALPAISNDLAFLARTLRKIVPTRTTSPVNSDSPISGKHVVFTGTMTQGSRSDMIREAEALGAISQSGVSTKTDYLVAGEKVGASKLAKAEKLGTTVLSEADYLALISR